jgi:hypothetical protein
MTGKLAGTSRALRHHARFRWKAMTRIKPRIGLGPAAQRVLGDWAAGFVSPDAARTLAAVPAIYDYN